MHDYTKQDMHGRCRYMSLWRPEYLLCNWFWKLGHLWTLSIASVGLEVWLESTVTVGPFCQASRVIQPNIRISQRFLSEDGRGSGLSDGAHVADQKSFLQAILSQSSGWLGRCCAGRGGVISRVVNDITSASNWLIGEVVQSRRRPLLGPSPGWKRLLPLSHLRHY